MCIRLFRFSGQELGHLGCSYLINKSSLTEWGYILSKITVEGRGKWLLMGRCPVSDSEVPKDQGMAYSQPIPIAQTGGRNMCSLNPGGCQNLLLEINWWRWMVVLRTGSRVSFSRSHLAKLGALGRWLAGAWHQLPECLGLCKKNNNTKFKKWRGGGGLWNGQTFHPVPCWRLCDLSPTCSSPGKVGAVIFQLCHHTSYRRDLRSHAPGSRTILHNHTFLRSLSCWETMIPCLWTH